MKKLSIAVIFCLLNFSLLGLNHNYANEHLKSSGELKLLELKRQGWEILEKHSEVQVRNGLKRYQSLKREVLIVKYRLRKGAEYVFCLVEYDSQLDTINEACDVSQ